MRLLSPCPTTATAPAGALVESSEGPSPHSDVDAFIFRLCLDHQLDALLLVLGAAATDRREGGVSSRPWRRWLQEDVDLTCLLAFDVLVEDGSLPAILGDAYERGSSSALVAQLISRYDAMGKLLEAMAADRIASSRPAHSARVRQALQQCRARLVDLQDYQEDVVTAGPLVEPGGRLTVRGEAEALVPEPSGRRRW